MNGTQAENLAFEYLQEQGIQLICRNFRSRLGELDLVCLQDNNLVFVEVRFRRNAYFGSAAATVDYRKQQKLIQAARYFLLKNPKFSKLPCRFDVIAITLREHKPKIDWIQNAFY